MYQSPTCAELTEPTITDILDVGSEICLVSPKRMITKGGRQLDQKDHHDMTTPWAEVPQDLSVDEERFFEDPEYNAAVNYMQKTCPDEICELAYETNAKYRAAIQTVLAPRFPSKKELSEKLSQMANAIAHDTFVGKEELSEKLSQMTNSIGDLKKAKDEVETFENANESLTKAKNAFKSLLKKKKNRRMRTVVRIMPATYKQI